MEKYIAFLFFTLLVACSNEEEVRMDGGIPIIKGVDVHLQSISGEDLLNPENPNAIKAENIRIYALYKGKEILTDDGPLASSEIWKYNVSIPSIDYKGNYSTTIYIASHVDENNRSTDIIKWNDSWVDTFRCELDNTGSMIQKLYVNDVLKDNLNITLISPENKKE